MNSDLTQRIMVALNELQAKVGPKARVAIAIGADGLCNLMFDDGLDGGWVALATDKALEDMPEFLTKFKEDWKQ